MDVCGFFLYIKVLFQSIIWLCMVRLRFPAFFGSPFLPELQLCCKSADTQMGKCIFRKRHLSQKAVLLFHLPDLPAVRKGVRQIGCRYDQGKDAKRLQYFCCF